MIRLLTLLIWATEGMTAFALIGEPSISYFGPGDRYRCKCNGGNCKMDDTNLLECFDGCKEGWTGPQCAYSLVKTNLPSWATDENPESCFSNTENEREPSLKGDFLQPQRLTSIYIQFEDGVKDLEPIQVEYTVHNRIIKKCPNISAMHPVDPQENIHLIEIYCPDPEDGLATNLTLSGTSVSSLCSVHISAGYREMPIESTSKSNMTRYTQEILATVQPNVTINGFSLDMNISVGTDIVKVCDNLDVEFLNVGDVAVTRVTDDSPSFKLVNATFYEFKFTPSLHGVVSVKATCNYNPSLDPPEITPHIFGDCVNNTFGKSCNYFCDCDKGGNCSPYGQCVSECFPGFKGDDCKIECSDHNYGPGCKKACHKNCGPPCNRRTGWCTDHCGDYPPKSNCSSGKNYTDDDGKPTASASREVEGYSDYMIVVVVGVIVMMSLLFVSVGSYMRNTNAAVDQNSSGQTKSADTVKSSNSVWGSGVCDDGEDVPHVSDLDTFSMPATALHTPADRRSIDTNFGSFKDSKTS